MGKKIANHWNVFTGGGLKESPNKIFGGKSGGEYNTSLRIAAIKTEYRPRPKGKKTCWGFSLAQKKPIIFWGGKNRRKQICWWL